MREWKSNGWSNKVWLLIAVVLGVGYHAFDWWWAPFAALAAGALSFLSFVDGRFAQTKDEINDLKQEVASLDRYASQTREELIELKRRTERY